MARKTAQEPAKDVDVADFPVPGRNRELIERANRLRAAVKAANGNQAVADRAAMHVGTLNRYLAGRDMKASALIALAAACNVSLDWLATGREPMRTGDQPAPPPGATSTGKRTIDVDRLYAAMDKALQMLHEHGNEFPPLRRFAAIVEVLYSDFSDQEVSQIMERLRHEAR